MEIRICGIYAMNVSSKYNRGLKISNKNILDNLYFLFIVGSSFVVKSDLFFQESPSIILSKLNLTKFYTLSKLLDGMNICSR